MAEKISVGKKKRIIAGALAGAVVVTGAGVGLGIGLAGGGAGPNAGNRIEFIVDAETDIEVVYDTNGQEIQVSNLQIGDVIQFPKPAQTFIYQGDDKEYFVGWAENREHTVPKYFVGEDTIEITEDVSTLHAIYMKASFDNLTFTEVDQETCTVSYNDVAVDEAKGGILVIPNEYDNKKVVAVDAGNTITDALAVIAGTEDSTIKTEQQTIITNALAAMQNKGSIKKVLVARGVESIDEYAFYDCNAMTNISFVDETFVVESGVEGQSAIEITEENVITAIKSNAFQGCSSLTNITIPAGVETVGVEAFYGCSALKTVVFEENSKLTAIPASMFRACSALKSVNIQKGIKEIGFGAFLDCSALESATFEEGSALTMIHGQAFRRTGLKSLDLSKCSSLTNLGTSWLYNAEETFTDKNWNQVYDEGEPYVDANENGVFDGNNIKTADGYQFADSAELEVIALPNSIEFINEYAFQNCTALKRITTDINDENNYSLPSSLGGVVDAWFAGCTSLEKVHLPKGIKEVFIASFQNCTALKEVKFHDECELVQAQIFNGSKWAAWREWHGRVFQGCSALESIELPKGWKNIEYRTFLGCSSLKSVKFNETNLTIYSDSNVFKGCTALETVAFAKGTTLKIDGSYLFTNCNSLKAIGEVNDEGEIEVNKLPAGATLHQAMFQGTALESFELPSNITEIPGFIFLGAKLTNITIPDSVTKIGQRAFESTKLENVVIPEKVTEIGYRAFQQIATLKSITFNCKNLTTVGGDAFQPFYTGEPFVDANGDGIWQEGEEYTDVNGDQQYTMEQPVPSQLTKITFGANVTNINFANGIWANAVASHKALKTIEFQSANPPTVANMPMTYVETIIVPAGSLEAYKAAFADYADLMVEASA